MVTSRGARRLSAIAVAALLVACTGGSGGDQGEQGVRGRLLLPDGAPAADITVALVEQADPVDIRTVRTVLVCAAQPRPAGCRTATTASAADGEFRLRVRSGVDRRPPGLTAVMPPGPGQAYGAAVAGSLSAEQDEVTLAAVRLWTTGGVRIVGPDSSARASWEQAPVDERDPRARYRLELSATDGKPLWGFDGDARGAIFDARVVEDVPAVVSAFAEQTTAVPPPLTRLVWRSAGTPLPLTPGAPRSRGRRCQFEPAAPGTNGSACGLTDGNFADAALPPDWPSLRSARVDLGATTTISLVVVRGAPGAQVEVSTDARKWALVGRADADDDLVQLKPGTRARYVRVRSESSLGPVRELSVW